MNFSITKKKSLVDESNELVAESKGIKSVFSEMKESLINKNMQLMSKAAEISDLRAILDDATESLSQESINNEGVIRNIEKILK